MSTRVQNLLSFSILTSFDKAYEVGEFCLADALFDLIKKFIIVLVMHFVR